MSATTTQTFWNLHDFTVNCGKPMALIFRSERDSCQKCGKSLFTDKEGHPFVVYHSQRGTYLGSRLTKLCRVLRSTNITATIPLKARKTLILVAYNYLFCCQRKTPLLTWLSLTMLKYVDCRCSRFCNIFHVLQSSFWLQVGEKGSTWGRVAREMHKMFKEVSYSKIENEKLWRFFFPSMGGCRKIYVIF